MKPFIATISVYFVMLVVMAYPTMLLWNMCLVPAVNGLNSVGFLQMIGIQFLFASLIKGITISGKNKYEF